MRTTMLTLLTSLFITPAAFAAPPGAQATKADPCSADFDSILDKRIERLSTLVQDQGAASSLRFAREIQSVWKLVADRRKAGCQNTVSDGDITRLTEADGWRVYQAICAQTLDRRLRKRVKQIRADLRARRHHAARQGLLQLAAEVGRDPQYGECQGLTARLDRLMSTELPGMWKDVIRDERVGTPAVTAAR